MTDTTPPGGTHAVENGNPSDSLPVSFSLSERERLTRRGWAGGRFGGWCAACVRELPFAAFARDASKASGRKSICKGCDREKSRRWYAANRDRKIAAVVDRRRAAKGGAA